MNDQSGRAESEPPVVALDGSAAVPAEFYGRRAHKLAKLSALGLPVPGGVALSFACVDGIARGEGLPRTPEPASRGRLMVLRASPEQRDWGRVPSSPFIGIGQIALPKFEVALGPLVAVRLLAELIPQYAHLVHDVEPEVFGAVPNGGQAESSLLEAMRYCLRHRLETYRAEIGTPFPDSPMVQVEECVRAMARSWRARSSRLLREARGAPPEAGLGVIIQEAVLLGEDGRSGRGYIQGIDSGTGEPDWQSAFKTANTSEPELESETFADAVPGILDALRDVVGRVRGELRDAFRVDFLLKDGRIYIIDAVPVRRGPRAALRVVVDLVRDGVIDEAQALLRIDPASLVDLLHPQIARQAVRDPIARGLSASPGAASGRLVFTTEAAQALAAQDQSAILLRAETGADDVRGMNSAKAVVTMRGGMTSHAAVIARGIGLPCVVGLSGARLDPATPKLIASDGREFGEGDPVTVDGTTGEMLAGEVEMTPPDVGGAVNELLAWADSIRELGVRANADTPAEAKTAREFGADGIGLCRTEHMFLEAERIGPMREMVFAESDAERRSALERLLTMQRADFVEMFEIMRGLPVTIRLLDPPLHEFLPSDPHEIEEAATQTGRTVDAVRARIRALAEVNPMLGMRGIRLGLLVPEIYEMQARAIFEAAAATNVGSSNPVVPEIMLPLVSANREVEIVKARIEAVAERAALDVGRPISYRLGVMVETPRAALRASDIAASSEFLSFGTNDLTQMAYGLSRDDAGQFMGDYVSLGVFSEDPFHALDLEGVGELMLIAARRGRRRKPNLVLALCGEHGGDPAAVRFCRLAGFNYVSCSAFRVPIARLAAAQATILARPSGPDGSLP